MPQKGAIALVPLVVLIVGVILAVTLFSKISFNKPQVAKKANNGAALVAVKLEYQNPFDDKTQYQNPFPKDNYDNPIDDLIFEDQK